MYRVAICDDNPAHLRLYGRMVEAYEEPVKAFGFQSAQALEHALFEEGQSFAVILCDIVLGSSDNGISLMERVQERFSNAAVIFISGYPQLVFDSYRVRHVYFLQKPVVQEKMHEALKMAIREARITERIILPVMTKSGTFCLRMDDIWFLESNMRKVWVHTEGENYQTYAKLGQIERNLDGRFIRCHQSYIVNMDYIAELSEGDFILRDGRCVRISRTYRRSTRETFFRYLESRLPRGKEGENG